MSASTIYEALRAAEMVKDGTTVMRNMMVESCMISNIIQRGMTKLSEAQYVTTIMALS